MEGMSFFPSLFCSLASLGSVTCYLISVLDCGSSIQNMCLKSFIPPGTRPFPSTWSPCRSPGTVTSVLPCSWHPSSTGSPSFAGAPCDCSWAPPALKDHAQPRLPLRIARRMATHCPSLPMATARAPQSPSWPLTEKSGVEGRAGREGRRMYQWVCKGKKAMREKTWNKSRRWPQRTLECL